MHKLVVSIMAFGLVAAATSVGVAAADGVSLNPDGSINVPAFLVPFSSYASTEARADLEFRLQTSRNAAAARVQGNAPAPESTKVPSPLYAPWVAAQWQRYPVIMTEDTVAGVGVQVFVPKAGVGTKNEHRVLVNLHGGAFTTGWPFGSQLESIPIAAVGGIKVISINYRMAPTNHFPAASEDVGNVYRQLLKTYRPSQIGIYGCSAGGILAGQAMAWFQKIGLPNPAAVGILSGAITKLSGDSMYVTPRLGGILPAPPVGDVDSYLTAITAGYITPAETNNPLMWPSTSPAVLAKFPPTLLMTGTRASEMSAAARSQVDLTKAGVDARLYLWDGADHCFMYNPELPESRESYDIAAKFFAEMMDRAERKLK